MSADNDPTELVRRVLDGLDWEGHPHSYVIGVETVDYEADLDLAGPALRANGDAAIRVLGEASSGASSGSIEPTFDRICSILMPFHGSSTREDSDVYELFVIPGRILCMQSLMQSPSSYSVLESQDCDLVFEAYRKQVTAMRHLSSFIVYDYSHIMSPMPVTVAGKDMWEAMSWEEYGNPTWTSGVLQSRTVRGRGAAAGVILRVDAACRPIMVELRSGEMVTWAMHRYTDAPTKGVSQLPVETVRIDCVGKLMRQTRYSIADGRRRGSEERPLLKLPGDTRLLDVRGGEGITQVAMFDAHRSRWPSEILAWVAGTDSKDGEPPPTGRVNGQDASGRDGVTSASGVKGIWILGAIMLGLALVMIRGEAEARDLPPEI